MHPGPSPQSTGMAPPASQENGGEEEVRPKKTEVDEADFSHTEVNTSCTEICGPGQWSRSCSKICLARIYPKGSKDMAIKAYVIMDDQSNRSLARPELFEHFGMESEIFPYRLRTCSGIIETSGKKAEGLQMESLDGKIHISLPPLTECPDIPNNRSEIPTPSAVKHLPHLRHIAQQIPELDPKAEILILLGRDVLRAHKVRQQVNGPHNSPFAQRLDLGWVVIGEVCLGSVHRPTVNTYKTHVLDSGRPSMFKPCPSFVRIKETRQGTKHDNKPVPSVEMGGISSRRASEIGENLTLDSTMDAAPQRKKKKKKAATIDLEDDQVNLLNGRTGDQTTDGEEVVKKPRKKKKSKVAESALPDDLDVEEDDIITGVRSGVPPPPGDFTEKDLYMKQWRQVQALVNQNTET
ncbi:uncharacterized protein LOC133420828 [Cololabis saira]|uniref:uncharacterized protein LOC133420828 n=1 Tax=Cololabis saira TaxID=129043 RepID=UPI002AD3CCE3|nr:uncharacterized protein LOC133420828 [Cololabis saira]